MNIVKIKPLSVNECWQGRRFKTPKYKSYETELLLLLPKIEVPLERIKLSVEIGFSNSNSDIDNIAKPFIDILQKKYLFNDKNIYKLQLEKVITKKGNEYIKFKLENYE